MAWKQPPVKYYDRLAMASKVKNRIEAHMEFGVPLVFDPPIPYTYRGGRKLLMNIERHQYISPQFKREFKTIRCLLDDGTYVRLTDLLMKHLVVIYPRLPK
jgi:hypothetical protein